MSDSTLPYESRGGPETPASPPNRWRNHRTSLAVALAVPILSVILIAVFASDRSPAALIAILFTVLSPFASAALSIYNLCRTPGPGIPLSVIALILNLVELGLLALLVGAVLSHGIC